MKRASIILVSILLSLVSSEAQNCTANIISDPATSSQNLAEQAEEFAAAAQDSAGTYDVFADLANEAASRAQAVEASDPSPQNLAAAKAASAAATAATAKAQIPLPQPTKLKA